MQYRNIKVKVPTPEISRMVQEKLFEHGVRWMSGNTNPIHTEYKHLLINNSGRIAFHVSEDTFNKLNYNQVHYLQILTGDDTGRLFEVDNAVFYQVNNIAYWIDSFRNELDNVEYNLEESLKGYSSVKLINVNEEEITMQSNEMPKLEAGKHVVKMKDGREALVLVGEALLYLDVRAANTGQFSGWDSFPIVSDRIEAIYEIENPSKTASINLLTDDIDNKYLTLIWKRDSEEDKRREEYEQLQRQIAELTSCVSGLQVSLDANCSSIADLQAQANKLGESL